jgi:hypothetical protein
MRAASNDVSWRVPNPASELDGGFNLKCNFEISG